MISSRLISKKNSFLYGLLLLIIALLFYFKAELTILIKNSDAPTSTLRVDVTNPITSMHPLDVSSSGSTYVFPLLYSYLAYPDEEGIFTPDLAFRWTIEENGLVYRFFLYPNARFHDGRPVKVEDVKNSILVTWENGRPGWVENIEHIGQGPGNALVVKLKKPDDNFFHKLGSTEIFTARQERGAESSPVGSGPFRFVERDEQGRVILEAFSKFYGPRPSIKRIVFHSVPDSDTVWSRLMLGETDVGFRMSHKNILFSRKWTDSFYFVKSESPFVFVLLYNNKSSLFLNNKARLAFTRALNRRHFIVRYLDPESKVPMGYILPNSDLSNSAIDPISYEPLQSYEGLRGLGWQDTDDDGFFDHEKQLLHFELIIPDGYMDELKIACEIQIAFYELGLKTEIKVLKMPDIVKHKLIPREYQAALIGINTLGSVEETWRGMPPGRFNFSGYRNPNIDGLLNLLVNGQDEQQRKSVLLRIEYLLNQEQPATLLYRRTSFDMVSKRVRNFNLINIMSHVTLLRRLSRSHFAASSPGAF